MIDERVEAHLQGFGETGRKTAVLYGCDAHVCIKQTAFDLLERGYIVFVVVDATTSMIASDRNIGIQMLRDAGCQLTTFQSLVFDLIKTSEHPLFRDFLRILKDAPDQRMPLDLVTLPEHMTVW